MEISEAAKAKARELLDYTLETHCENSVALFVQRVSDAAESILLHPRGPSLWKLCNETLAPFILPEPVDPLLIEAREMAAADIIECGTSFAVESDDGHMFCGSDAAPVIRAGHADGSAAVQGRLRALKRGMELAK